MRPIPTIPRLLGRKRPAGVLSRDEGGTGAGPVAAEACGGFGDGLAEELREGRHAADDETGGEFGKAVRGGGERSAGKMIGG